MFVPGVQHRETDGSMTRGSAAGMGSGQEASRQPPQVLLAGCCGGIVAIGAQELPAFLDGLRVVGATGLGILVFLFLPLMLL